MHTFERYIVQQYVRNALRGIQINKSTISESVYFGRKQDFRPAWERLRKTMLDAPDRAAPASVSGLEKRLAWLASNLRLSELDQEILGCMVRHQVHGEVVALVGAADPNAGVKLITALNVARLLGIGAARVRRRLVASKPLLALGLVTDAEDDDYSVSYSVLRIARLESCSENSLRSALFGRTLGTRLGWEEFDQLGPERDLAARVLSGARTQKRQGINLLFYGPPGSGKSAFAQVLALRAGCQAAFVGERGEEDEPSRDERIAAFRLAAALAAKSTETLLVVDEADDIFVGVDEGFAFGRRGSKVFTNRMLETSAVPAIWIVNDAARLGPTALRRMSLAIRFPELSREKRERVLTSAGRRHGLRIPAALIEELVALKASPAILDQSIQVAKLSDTGAAGVELAARSILSAINGRAGSSRKAALGLDLALWSADSDLTRTVEAVRRAEGGALSFCLYGPPGTGKSAFARYLADKMGVDVIEKRASDLFSMWLGETEKAVVQAFEEAADTGAMLIFDEADSLLRDRRLAAHSWEVTQVNEMLTWMERHPFPFICTTNLMEALDPATLRRFLFKIRFGFMRRQQIAAAFLRSFGASAPEAVLELAHLTPGDFALVRAKARALSVNDPAVLARWLSDEVALKPQANRRLIGFLNEGSYAREA